MMVAKVAIWVLSFTAYTLAEPWVDLHSRFATNDPLRQNSFYKMSRTLLEATREGWTQPPELIHQKGLKVLCRARDPTICMAYNFHGAIAGYQISIPRSVDTLNILGINYESKGYRPTTYFGRQLYTITLYLESQGSLFHGGRKFNGLTGTGLWVPIRGKYTEIPRRSNHLGRTGYIRQNCIDQMGVHHFYNMTNKLTREGFGTIFLLYSNNGDLIGFGHDAFGGNILGPVSSNNSKRNWFENAVPSLVRDVAPDTPDWAMDYFSRFGMFRHHVYFTKEPWLFKCSK